MAAGERRPPARGGFTAAIDPKRGAIFGAGAWAFGVVLTAVLSWIEFKNAASALDGLGSTGDPLAFLPSPVDVVGFMFYNAHFVDVGFDFGIVGMWVNIVHGSVNVTGMAATQASGTDLSSVSDLERALDLLVGTVPTVVWLLVPVVTLAWGGYMVTARNEVAGPTEGAKTGASVVVGYFVLAVAGSFLFAWRIAPSGEMAEITLRPQLTMAAGLMGLVYPAVFGGLGGWVAVRTGAAGIRSAPPHPGPGAGRPATPRRAQGAGHDVPRGPAGGHQDVRQQSPREHGRPGGTSPPRDGTRPADPRAGVEDPNGRGGGRDDGRQGGDPRRRPRGNRKGDRRSDARGRASEDRRDDAPDRTDDDRDETDDTSGRTGSEDTTGRTGSEDTTGRTEDDRGG